MKRPSPTSTKEDSMREREIEKTLVSLVRKCGGLALKLVSPGFDGMPDRLVLLPEGRVVFIELKRPATKPRPLQVSRHRMLRNLGFEVHVLDSMETVKEFADGIHTA